MGRYKKNDFNKNKGILLVSSLFAIIGIILIIIGFYNYIVSCLVQFGIVLLVISATILLFIIYLLIKKKIEDI